MPVRRSSPAVLAYISIALVQFIAVLIINGGGISLVGALLSILLFGFLYLGKPLAWWILVLMNTLGLLAYLFILLSDAFKRSGHILWGNVILLVVTTAAMEAVLLSPGMRRHVASRGLRLAPRQARPPRPPRQPRRAPERG